MRIQLLIKESYIETIKNSINSSVFKTLWAVVDGEKQDILDAGRKSCGVFTSSILLMFGFIKERHATVSGTIKDMERSGWFEIQEPRIGCILRWEKKFGNGEDNDHIGFYIGDHMAISTSSKECVPIEHHFTYGEENGEPKRKIVAIYWHENLS